VRNFYWLPFTPPLVAFFGPSVKEVKGLTQEISCKA
jgi:chromosome segregation ATPase